MAMLRSSGACRALANTLRIPVMGNYRGVMRKYSNTTKEEEDEVTGAELSDCGLPQDHEESDAEHPAQSDQPSIQHDTKYAKKPPPVQSTFGNFGPGVYKGILLGCVGQTPVEKMFNNGSSVVIFSLGTGGLRNNRKQNEGENSEAYAERSVTQWHRVCVFKGGLLNMASKIKKGTNVYVEGNVETRVYNDPVTGVVKRIREICVRQSGRLYVVDQDAVV